MVVGLLATLVDVDVYRIVPAEPYPTDYEETVAQNSREQDAHARPRIADPLPGLAGYDRVVLASGIWNVRPPMIMRTFAEALDFTGTTVHPLTTHAGSRLGRAADVYREACRGATIAEGLAVRGEEAAAAEHEVRAWLRRVGLG
ncbi:MAG: flavodoxin [Propionicimonas sp.]